MSGNFSPSDHYPLALIRVIRLRSQQALKKVNLRRGCKQCALVDALHFNLLEDLDRLRKLSVIFNIPTLCYLAIDILLNRLNNTNNFNMIDPGQI